MPQYEEALRSAMEHGVPSRTLRVSFLEKEEEENIRNLVKDTPYKVLITPFRGREVLIIIARC